MDEVNNQLSRFSSYITALITISTTLLAVAPVFVEFIGRRRNPIARRFSWILLVSFIAGLFCIVYSLSWIFDISNAKFTNQIPLPPIFAMTFFLIQGVTFIMGTLTIWFQDIGILITRGRRQLTVNAHTNPPNPTILDERKNQQSLLTQRLVIFLSIHSLLFLAFVTIKPGQYDLLVKALPVMGLLVTIIGLFHFWFKKNDLNQIDPPSGSYRKYMKGRWIGVYSCIAFGILWGISIEQVFFPL